MTSGVFCDLIHRDSRTGSLWISPGFIANTNINSGSLKTSGLDISMNYNYNLAKYGGLGFAFNGTYVDKYENQPISGGGSYDCVGYYGATCGGGAGGVGLVPKWRHKFRTVWSAPYWGGFDLAVTWRHIDSVKLDALSSNPFMAGSGNPIAGDELGARDYMDLAFTWTFWKKWTLRAGVNNVFDRDPPLCDSGTACGAPFGNGNTYPGTYDSMGRKFFTGLTVNF